MSRAGNYYQPDPEDNQDKTRRARSSGLNGRGYSNADIEAIKQAFIDAQTRNLMRQRPDTFMTQAGPIDRRGIGFGFPEGVGTRYRAWTR